MSTSVWYYQVQSKVNMKYDTWHKEILSKFASRLGDNMQDFYGTVSKVIKLIITSVVVESTSFEDCNGFFCPS